MKKVTISNQMVGADNLENVFEYLLESSAGNLITSKAVEWMGFCYSILIVTEDGNQEQTLHHIGDLLRSTLMDHRRCDFKTLSHVIQSSIEYNYCGTTVIHDTMDDAIDYANYMRIRIYN